MSDRFVPIVTDEALVSVLESFCPQVVYAFDPEAGRVETSEFIMYAPTQIARTEEQRYLMQEMLIVHVATNRPEGLEWDMYAALQDAGLRVQSVAYDSQMLTDRQNRSDVLLFTVQRKVKDTMASRVQRRTL